MVTEKAIHSNLAIPPGEYLEEVLGELGMTKDELAHRMGRPATKLSPIFKGEKAITPDTALQLEMVVGVPAHIWTGLEAEYRLTLARQEMVLREEQLKTEIGLLAKFPFNELVKAGEIEKCKRPIDKVRAQQEFFGVMSLRSIPELKRYHALFRFGKSASSERSPEAIAAWLRMGERRAQRIFCAPFSQDRLKSVLEELRAMTIQQPVDFQAILRSRLSECGIALIISPHFPKTRTYGAAFRLGREKVVLMITKRGKWSDIFWFSIFHEIGHILLHNWSEVILEQDIDDDREQEADRFAADTLIPPDSYTVFKNRGIFYPDQIKEFAKKIRVDPGIIVGRLQHDKLIRQNWGNELRRRYDLEDSPR
jgi:HTH-type transcriptional regulator / antitoxin HigA